MMSEQNQSLWSQMIVINVAPASKVWVWTQLGLSVWCCGNNNNNNTTNHHPFMALFLYVYFKIYVSVQKYFFFTIGIYGRWWDVPNMHNSLHRHLTMYRSFEANESDIATCKRWQVYLAHFSHIYYTHAAKPLALTSINSVYECSLHMNYGYNI